MVQPIPGADVTCDFGVPGSWQAGYHTGRDYRARTALPVRATAGGRVVFAGQGAGGWGAAYGVHVIVDSQGVRHLYAHLSATNVRIGDVVRRAQQVGVSGNTGNTSGPHLHYEERVHPYTYGDHRSPRLDLQSTARVNLDLLVEAFHQDPGRPQGSGLHPRMVRTVERALLAEGLLEPGLATDGYAGTATQEAYRCWQHRLGLRNADADGIPGQFSLQALGDKHGFSVTRTRRKRTLLAQGDGQPARDRAARSAGAPFRRFSSRP